jgi:hypothetical protein
MPDADWCFEFSRKCLLDERTGPLVSIASLGVAIVTLFVGVGVAIWVYLRQERLSKQLAAIQIEVAWNSRRDELIERLRKEPDEGVARRRLREAERYVPNVDPRASIFSHDLMDLHRAYWVNPAVRLPDANTWPKYHDAVTDIALTLPKRFSSDASSLELLGRVKPFLKRLAEDKDYLSNEAIEVFRNRREFTPLFVQKLLADAPQLARVVSSLADTKAEFDVVAIGLADAVRYEFYGGLDEEAANSFIDALCDISESQLFRDWLRTSDRSLALLARHLRSISECFHATNHYIMCKAVHESLRHASSAKSSHPRGAGDEDQTRSDLRFARTYFAKWNSAMQRCNNCPEAPVQETALAAISNLEGLLAPSLGGA